MDIRYLQYAQGDRTFYEQGAPAGTDRSMPFGPSGTRDWTGWLRGESRSWSVLTPPGAQLPDQGWKIHVSGTLSNAAEVLDLVSACCHDRGLAFKFVPTEAELLLRNAKYADRGSSGKFITVYPTTVQSLHETLVALDAVVGGADGPRILSDLRWRTGPLYVRYGGFALHTVRDENDELVPAIQDPAGAWVPDVRGPSFAPPSWVPLPDFLADLRVAPGDAAAPADLDYDIQAAMAFSNAGGVYRAVTRSTGEQVVLKEGRPFAGLTPDRRDAVARLRAEERYLRDLADLPSVVDVREAFTLADHRFLVLDHIDGQDLPTVVAGTSPAARAGATRADYIAYRDRALRLLDAVERAVEGLHERGLVHGDLHPGNILVRPDDSVVLIDFEMTHTVGDSRPLTVGAPGFVPADGRSGIAADTYALACLKLFMFVPLTILLSLDSAKLEDLLDAARSLFDLPEDYLDSIRSGLDLPVAPIRPRSALALERDAAIRDWAALSENEEGIIGLQVLIARSIDASADLSRADRAYPGDIRQFTENGFGLAHGTAGVLHALAVCSFDIDPLAVSWLVSAVRADPGNYVGLYDGLAGAAWVLRELGRHDDADQIRARLPGADPHLGADLYGGLPGLGLFYLSELDHGHEPAGLLDQVVAIADLLRATQDRRPSVSDSERGLPIATGTGGLMRGATGTALFALRLYEHTGDQAHLALACDALDVDLAHCAVVDDGSLQVNEGWRTMPYLATGSAGIGVVLAQLIPHLLHTDRSLADLAGIERAAHAPFVIEPNLDNGRAGLIHFLAALTRSGLAGPRSEQALADHAAALRLHAIRHNTGISFPGEQLLRLSSDLATGSAGVLTALEAINLLSLDKRTLHRACLLPLVFPAAPVRPATERVASSGVAHPS